LRRRVGRPKRNRTVALVHRPLRSARVPRCCRSVCPSRCLAMAAFGAIEIRGSGTAGRDAAVCHWGRRSLRPRCGTAGLPAKRNDRARKGLAVGAVVALLGSASGVGIGTASARPIAKRRHSHRRRVVDLPLAIGGSLAAATRRGTRLRGFARDAQQVAFRCQAGLRIAETLRRT
jgi:hypothetical protein